MVRTDCYCTEKGKNDKEFCLAGMVGDESNRQPMCDSLAGDTRHLYFLLKAQETKSSEEIDLQWLGGGQIGRWKEQSLISL